MPSELCEVCLEALFGQAGAILGGWKGRRQYGGLLGHLASILVPSWGILGTILGHLGASCGLSWGHLAGILGHLGGIFGAFWGILGHLGTSWGHLGAILRQKRAQGGLDQCTSGDFG